jgi:hypothetical protein
MPHELASEPRVSALKLWRAVEAQHAVSTLRLVDHDAGAQEVLEQILEESKPAIPAPARHLDYLLATPFRYPPPRGGSRFRAEGDPGVLYGAGHRRTACAEAGYWRWRFVRDSAGLREIAATPQTVFQFGARGRAIDLREPPYVYRSLLWTSATSYAHTQQLARTARTAGVELIRYESVRDPGHGACAAILTPAAIRPPRPLARETWYLTVTETTVLWQRDRERWVFQFPA